MSDYIIVLMLASALAGYWAGRSDAKHEDGSDARRGKGDR